MHRKKIERNANIVLQWADVLIRLNLIKNKNIMDLSKIENMIEAILFASGNAIEISAIVDGLDLQKSEVKKALKKLDEKYSGVSGLRLLQYNNKIQFATNPDYADSVAAILNPIKEKELTNAALETIAIIAYRQPVTRLEVEQIRGVSCEYAVQVLLKHNLIEEVGRKDAVGKPALFGTTENFLKRFQISSLKQLPDYEELLANISALNQARQEKQDSEEGLYHEYEVPTDAVKRDAKETKSKKSKGKEKEFEIPGFLQDEKGITKID